MKKLTPAQRRTLQGYGDGNTNLVNPKSREALARLGYLEHPSRSFTTHAPMIWGGYRLTDVGRQWIIDEIGADIEWQWWETLGNWDFLTATDNDECDQEYAFKGIIRLELAGLAEWVYPDGKKTLCSTDATIQLRREWDERFGGDY